MAKRFFVDKHHGDKNAVTQVGGGSKTGDKAQALRQEMRARRQPGSSDWFTVREGRKK